MNVKLQKLFSSSPLNYISLENTCAHIHQIQYMLLRNQKHGAGKSQKIEQSFPACMIGQKTGQLKRQKESAILKSYKYLQYLCITRI